MCHVTLTMPILVVICHPKARTRYSLNCMQNLTTLASAVPEISLRPQNLEWVTWPWPCPFFCMLALNIIYLGTKFYDCSCSLLRDMVGAHKNFDGSVSRDLTILHRFWDTAKYWSKITDLNLPHLCLVPPLGVTLWNFATIFLHQQTRVPGLSYSIVCMILGFADLVEHRLVADGWTP